MSGVSFTSLMEEGNLLAQERKDSKTNKVIYGSPIPGAAISERRCHDVLPRGKMMTFQKLIP